MKNRSCVTCGRPLPSAWQSDQSGRAKRCYTVAQVCEALEIPRRSFFHLRQTGQLPFVEELLPRIGRVLRFRADLIDRYLAGELTDALALRKRDSCRSGR